MPSLESSAQSRMIYLASPYSHPDSAIKEDRFVQACKAAGNLIAKGYIVYSPIAHTHPIAVHCNLPTSWDYWAKVDRIMIAMCDTLVVLQLPGWQESRGVIAEIEIAAELGLEIIYLEPDL